MENQPAHLRVRDIAHKDNAPTIYGLTLGSVDKVVNIHIHGIDTYIRRLNKDVVDRAGRGGCVSDNTSATDPGIHWLTWSGGGITRI